MATRNEEAVLARFIDKFPDMPLTKVASLFERYQNVCKTYLVKISEKQIANFPKARAFNECGEFRYKKQRYWVWKEFGEGVPYVYTIQTGNNIIKKTSTVKLSHRDIDALIDLEDDIIVNQYYDGVDLNNCEPVKIDINSLQNYINQTKFDIDDNPNDHRQKTWRQQLQIAKKIKIVAKHFYNHYDDYVLPQIYSPSKHGRMYFKGLSLHYTSKQLRSACLGKAMQYDLHAAAFAIRLILAQNIVEKHNMCFDGMFTFTKEYLEYKDVIRRELGDMITAYDNRSEHNKHNTAGEKLIKQTISAIGFGASTTSGSWQDQQGQRHFPAINRIIRNPKDRETVLDNPWMKEFIKEQKEVTKLITEYYDDNPAISKKEVMHHVFQQTETMIMDEICELIDKDAIITRVHDAIYTNRPLLQREVENIRVKLAGISPYLKLDKERINPWYNNILAERLENEQKQRIKQEEQYAKQYISAYSSANQMIDTSIKYKGDSIAHDSFNKNDIGNAKCYDKCDDGKQHYTDSNLTETETYKQMTYQQQKQFKEIMGITDQPQFINKLLGKNK